MGDGIQKKVDAVFDEISDEEYKLENTGLSLRYRKTFKFLSIVVKNFDCNSYAFVLAQTKLVERIGKTIVDSAQEILENYAYDVSRGEQSTIPDKVAFAALYYVGVACARAADKERFRKLLQNNVKLFFGDEFIANTYLIFSRYCGVIKDYKRMIVFSQKAIQSHADYYAESDDDTEKKFYLGGIAYASAVGQIAEYCFLRNLIYGGKKEDFLRAATAFAKPNKGGSETAEKEMTEYLSKAVKPTGKYTCDDLNEEFFNKALFYTIVAKEVNPDYPKYPYLQAQLMFYNELYLKGEVSEKTIKSALVLIDEAIDNVERTKGKNKDYRLLKERYDNFKEIVSSCPADSPKWHETDDYALAAEKSKIVLSADIKHAQPKTYNNKTKAPYVFVSYSSKDYKSVYCDMLEYKKVGILCDYDRDMTSYEKSEIAERQKWYEVVEEKIRSCAGVICYLSEDYVVSSAILTELKLIEKYNKPLVAIDLSGNYRISELFMRVAKNSELSPRVTSDGMYWFSKKFDDNNNVIARNGDPFATEHVEHVKSRLSILCPEVINGYEADYAIKTNVNKNRPNEDYLRLDERRHVYVVADGITLQKPLRYPASGKSLPQEIAQKFCNVFVDTLCSELLVLLREEQIPEKFAVAFKGANKKVSELLCEYDDAIKYRLDGYLDEGSDVSVTDVEKPGAVALAAAVYNDTLYYASVGDCVGILVRNGQKIVFADKQTSGAFEKKKVESDRKTLQREYINNVNNPCGYGVVNGDERAEKFFNVSHISLEYGDVVYLLTDGVADYVRYSSYSSYASLSAQEIIDQAVEFEGKDEHDDMALIVVKWKSDLKTTRAQKRANKA